MQGPQGGGLRDRPRQLEPGDDHDRPRVRRRDVHRAAAARPAGADHRARAPRCAAADARRPDGAQPGQGAARGRHARALRRRAHRRRLRRHRARRGPRPLPPDHGGGGAEDAAQRDRHVARRRAGRAPRPRAAVHRAPGLHPGWPRRRHRPHRGGLRAHRRARAGGVADRPDPARPVGPRLGRVRARGHARPPRQRRDRVLDRERRPDGRAHRRQRHRGAAADAHRPPLPARARPGHRRHPRRGRGDRRLQRPVRRRPGERGDPRHRDEPARLALERAGLQGDGLPDRQDRRAAGRRLRAGGDPQRHHPDHAGELRADDRLRGGQVAALRLREVPRRGPEPLDAHEVGGRGDVDRAHLPAGLRQGAAQPRARHRHQARRRRRADAAGDARAPGQRPLRRRARGLPQGRERRRGPRAHRDRPVVPGGAARPGARPRRRRWPASAPSSRSTPARPSSPRARRTTTRAGSAGSSTRSSAASARASSSSAAGPTASARASSSTTAASTPR